jgi:DNA-binding CsgD family transcriptional regulator
MKNIWFVSDKKLKILKHSSNGYNTAIYNWGLSNELITNHENVYLPNPESAIVSVDNAFIRIDLAKDAHNLKDIKTYIKSLSSSRNDSILCNGQAVKPISIPYSLNSIKIYYAATDFTQTSDILYVYRLKGLEEEWSIPSPEASKEYTNLPEGRYTFEVKAFVNGNTEFTNTATITFTISPPWYRSPLAYSLYFTLVALLLFLFYKKTISKQKKIILQKGEELIAQTKRHEEETKQKDQEIYALQNENLKNELHYKTQEMNGYVLNIIRKNEMLEEVKKDALGISKAIDEEKQLSIIRQKVMRLITQINSNIEHDVDFQVFQSNFDLIHQDFFKLLDERFPGLSRNDKILCAYLNMNLSSKEIAPLLNISVRGVEVNRYRLRKKMNLDRDINLSEYLQNLK